MFGLLLGLFGYSVGGIAGVGQSGAGFFQLFATLAGALLVNAGGILFLFGFNSFTAIPLVFGRQLPAGGERLFQFSVPVPLSIPVNSSSSVHSLDRMRPINEGRFSFTGLRQTALTARSGRSSTDSKSAFRRMTRRQQHALA